MHLWRKEIARHMGIFCFTLLTLVPQPEQHTRSVKFMNWKKLEKIGKNWQNCQKWLKLSKFGGQKW